MQFDDRNDHQKNLDFLVKELEESMEHHDLSGVERACHNIHLYLGECAVRGKYSFVGKTMENVAGLLTLPDSVLEKLIILDEFPVSLKAYIDISRSSDDPRLQMALVQNIIEHQTFSGYRYESFDPVLTQWGRALSKRGNELALIALLDHAIKVNQDMVLILFVSALREMKQHSKIVAAWACDNYAILSQLIGIPREFRPTFRELVDYRSFGCPVSDSQFALEKVGDLDLFYYLKTVEQPVPESILKGIGLLKKIDATPKLTAYSWVSGTHSHFQPVQPNVQSLEIVSEALKLCVKAVNRGFLVMSDALTDRIALNLDRLLVDFDPKYVQRLVSDIPREWVVKSELCRSVTLEIDLGL